MSVDGKVVYHQGAWFRVQDPHPKCLLKRDKDLRLAVELNLESLSIF